MITHVSESELFEKLVAMVQAAKKVDHASRLMESKRDACATFLEELIDACVLELYFPDEAAAKDLQFMDKVAELLNVPQASRLPASAEDSSFQSQVSSFVATANAPSHPIRNQLLRLAAECDAAQASSDLFAIIKQEGRV